MANKEQDIIDDFLKRGKVLERDVAVDGYWYGTSHPDFANPDLEHRKFPEQEENTMSATYQEYQFNVCKTKMLGFETAIKRGLEYAKMSLQDHDATLGRTTLKNKVWAEIMEDDIRQMEKALEYLKELRL